MTLVLDASAIFAALIDPSPLGTWARELAVAEHLAATHLLPSEVANVLRRRAAAGQISEDTATLAHADLLAMTIELVPYRVVAERAWTLRHNLTANDAWYVAVAELLDAPLATLDHRLARSEGPRCRFLTP